MQNRQFTPWRNDIWPNFALFLSQFWKCQDLGSPCYCNPSQSTSSNNTWFCDWEGRGEGRRVVKFYPQRIVEKRKSAAVFALNLWKAVPPWTLVSSHTPPLQYPAPVIPTAPAFAVTTVKLPAMQWLTYWGMSWVVKTQSQKKTFDTNL